MNFEEAERLDGVRLSWNVWPTSRLEATKLIIPLGVMYTPLIRSDEVVRCNYRPCFCRNDKCQSILSPWCEVDWINKFWVCPLCLNRNPFPPNYSHITPDQLPYELKTESTTIEYEVKQETLGSTSFLFIIDTCIADNELTEIKSSISQALTLLPPDSMVGLITFGRHVYVHEIGYSECAKSIIFRGDCNEEKEKEVTIDKIKTLLNINPKDEQSILRFFQPVSQIEATFNQVLDDLTKDQWQPAPASRSLRCTGVACLVGVALLEASLSGYSARMMLLSGGAPTCGPGTVVEADLAKHIRSHRDIVKGKARYYENSVKFYTELADHAVANGHVIDIFACCLDQPGVAEQRILVDKTGGAMILSDTFTTSVFVESFRGMFMYNGTGEYLSMCFNSEIRVRTSRQIKVSGCIGAVSTLKEQSSCVSSNTIGLGGTSKWNAGGLFPNSTFCFFFDVASNQSSEDYNTNANESGYVQFLTTYRTSYGTNVIRVTTFGVSFANPAKKEGLDSIIAGFDQDTAAVVLARMAVYKADTEFEPDLMRWLDQQLIKTVSKFAAYQKGDPDSFALPNEFLLFPQFMFYLRRSEFIQSFNYSPDETAFFRSIIIRETVGSALSMIQPILYAYSTDKDEFENVPLELSSRHNEKILLLDTFFHLVIWYGRKVSEWRNDRIWEKDNNFEWFKQWISLPKQECLNRAQIRFPYPNVIECDEGSGQQRFLIAKLNPDNSNAIPSNPDEEIKGDVLTDDVTLKVFMQHLKRLAVNPS